MRRKNTETFQPSGDVRRVQSLGGGTFVRIGDHRGKWHQLAVRRDQDDIHNLLIEVGQIDDQLAGRIVAELVALDPEQFDWCADLHANGYTHD